MTSPAGEFIRRFLLHVLPDGFRRIRHFGFLANACRPHQARADPRRPRVSRTPAPAKPSDYRERYAMLTGRRLDRCPRCGGCMVDLGLSLPRHRPASRPTPDATAHDAPFEVRIPFHRGRHAAAGCRSTQTRPEASRSAPPLGCGTLNPCGPVIARPLSSARSGSRPLGPPARAGPKPLLTARARIERP